MFLRTNNFDVNMVFWDSFVYIDYTAIKYVQDTIDFAKIGKTTFSFYNY